MRFEVGWQPRPQPLRPECAVAMGPARTALLARLRRLPEDHQTRLAGVIGPEVVAVVGAEEDLPWVEAVQYFGTDPAAPALWLPTNRVPTVPLPLLQAAILRRCPEGATPVVLLEHQDQLRGIPLGSARPLDAAWLSEQP